ncbi:hypothetical protein [Algoriphagus sp. CAU 1675]|uniref:hypothetical protein n=1 Tax=Algoriphagus sp. CAU 1675 TaxID=3032597 RepID=UPI0023DADD4F|nr:hypothetical protein [Algoriphagus sp. CAU 1675]MDF2158083.1 hypothetical protein [Algoriphagus sp. CAU 1675]
MRLFNRLSVIALLSLSFGFLSCESEDPVMENEGEVITDVNLNFTELDDSGNPVGLTFTFNASDSEGIEIGGSPVVQTVTLTKGKTYRMEIEVKNTIENEDITEEILEEAAEHQFYFLGTAFVGSSAPLTYIYDDESGELIGVRGIVTVEEFPGFNNAEMRIVLRHDLDKNYPGADDPNFENFVLAGGETDLDIRFPLVLE